MNSNLEIIDCTIAQGQMGNPTKNPGKPKIKIIIFNKSGRFKQKNN
jgi:hypothetical protein